MAKLTKPKKKSGKSYWDFHEVTNYLEQLHGKDFRDYAGKWCAKGNEEKPYLDFWHWIIDGGDIHNGCFFYMPDRECLNDPEVEDWKKEIVKYYVDFLGDDYDEEMWVDW